MPVCSTSFGPVLIQGHAGKIATLAFAEEQEGEEQVDALTLEVVQQLQEYFSGKRKTFSLAFTLEGTAFQQKVWAAVSRVPYGHTCSYAELAKKLGQPEAVRAVAAAVGANPVLILIPCHRIIGSDGKLRGYAGGLEKKKALLQLEGRAVQGTLF
ncbi:MAG: methylated-DNA--[protein]-cysteine S-methyltransferase [Algoriphagus sp.]|nr:methylated-DNA--[protein]-cysteine S-methyltransferase [Algoriphagus sp.]